MVDIITPPLIDPFHRIFYKTLTEEVYNRSVVLLSGSAPNFEEYKYQIGYINGLNSALGVAESIEKNMYGAKPGDG